MSLFSETVNGLLFRQTERQTEWMNDIYFPPWCRAGPYFVGVLLGFVLYRINGRLKIHPVGASLLRQHSNQPCDTCRSNLKVKRPKL